MDTQQFNTFAMSLNHLQRLMRLSLKADLAQLELLNKALHGAQVPHNKVLVIGEIKTALGLPADDDVPPMPDEQRKVVEAQLAFMAAPTPKPLTFTDVPSDGDDGPDVDRLRGRDPPYGAGVWPGIGR